MVAAPPSVRRLPAIGIGPIVVVASLVLVIAVGIVVLPRIFGGDAPDSTAKTGPTPSAVATDVAAGSPSPTPSAVSSDEPLQVTPTPPGNEPPLGETAKAAIVTFLEEFDAAYRVGNSDFLLEHLDPSVIAAYSRSACRDSIESFARPDFATKVDSVSGPSVWTYMPGNGQSTIIAVAYVVTGERTRAGRTTPLSMHLSFDAGNFFWFSSGC